MFEARVWACTWVGMRHVCGHAACVWACDMWVGHVCGHGQHVCGHGWHVCGHGRHMGGHERHVCGHACTGHWEVKKMKVGVVTGVAFRERGHGARTCKLVRACASIRTTRLSR